MNIVVAAPLYPPEIGGGASYAKEVARRLAARHAVTVVTMAYRPETIPGVRIVSVDKHKPRWIRITQFVMNIVRETRRADVLVAQNGPSVELSLLAPMRNTPVIFHITDRLSHTRSKNSFFKRTLLRVAAARAKHTMVVDPPPKPERISFLPEPTNDMASYESWWQVHMQVLESHLQSSSIHS